MLFCGTSAAFYVQLRTIYHIGNSRAVSLTLVTSYALFAMVIACIYLSIFHRPRWSRSETRGSFLPMNPDEVFNCGQVFVQMLGAIAMHVSVCIAFLMPGLTGTPELFLQRTRLIEGRTSPWVLLLELYSRFLW